MLLLVFCANGSYWWRHAVLYCGLTLKEELKDRWVYGPRIALLQGWMDRLECVSVYPLQV